MLCTPQHRHSSLAKSLMKWVQMVAVRAGRSSLRRKTPDRFILSLRQWNCHLTRTYFHSYSSFSLCIPNEDIWHGEVKKSYKLFSHQAKDLHRCLCTVVAPLHTCTCETVEYLNPSTSQTRGTVHTRQAPWKPEIQRMYWELGIHNNLPCITKQFSSIWKQRRGGEGGFKSNCN